MRKHIAVLLILVALLSVSVYGYMTYVQPRAHGESTILTLNTTADIQQVGITDYHKKVKKTGESTSSVLSASQISDAYTKILKEIYGDAEIKLNVYGPFKYDNGKAVYYIEAVVEKDNFVEYVYMIVDGNKLPGDGKIDTIYTIYVCHMDKNDNVQAKLSEDDILKLAKAEYAKHRTPADNDTYDVFSYVSDDNKTIYNVDVNKGVMLATYDGDTGELLDLFVEEEQAQVHTQEECRQLAQETLNSKDCNYSQYLSLGDAQEQTDNGSTNYTYSVIYQNGDDKQVLGSIKINANNLSLISFDMHDPEVEENDTNETETVEDDYNNYDDSDNNNYDDSSSSSSSQSSSSSSGSSSRSSSGSSSSGSSGSSSSSSRSNNYYGDGYSY